MSILDLPFARLLGLGDDGPVRPDGRWLPDHGRELYFHAHLTESSADDKDDPETDRWAFEVVRRIRKAGGDTTSIIELVEAKQTGDLPENRYVVEADGNVRHITRDRERRIVIAPRPA